MQAIEKQIRERAKALLADGIVDLSLIHIWDGTADAHRR